jgi:prepilin-type N-terminal cleavage/methylation domain-containing protein
MGDKIFKVIPRSERRKFERGFTLIELLATLVIISVVAAVLVPRYI